MSVHEHAPVAPSFVYETLPNESTNDVATEALHVEIAAEVVEADVETVNIS